MLSVPSAVEAHGFDAALGRLFLFQELRVICRNTAFEYHKAFPGSTFVYIAQAQQTLGGRNALVVGEFQPPRSFRDRFSIIIRPFLKIMGPIHLKYLAKVIEQRGLTGFDREDVVCAKGINRDNTTSHGKDA